MNFYPFNIGDFAAATRHLTWDESMAYRVLLDAYYSREEPLPLDMTMVYRLAGAAAPKHRQAVDAVLAEFFVKDVGGYRNARCDEEIVKTQIKKEKAKSSAAKRWSGTQQSEGNADAMRTHMPTHSEGNAPNPNPNPKEERERARAAGEPEQVQAPETQTPDPAHWADVQAITADKSAKLDHWEAEFLETIRWKSSLTKAQRDSLKAIQAKIAAKPLPAPMKASVKVFEGTLAWEAWRKAGVKINNPVDLRDDNGRIIGRGWYFETEFPPNRDSEAA